MNILKARTSQFSYMYAFLIFGCIFSVSFVGAMSEKIQKLGLDEKSKTRMSILLRHIGNYNEINNSQLIVKNKTYSNPFPHIIKILQKTEPYVRATANIVIIAGQTIETIDDLMFIASFGNEMRKNFKEYRTAKKEYVELKKTVENNFKINGYYLDKETFHRLSNLLLINKIQASADFFRELQLECAINLLRYPYYLQDDYEKIHIDLLYDRDDMESPEKIIKSKIYQSQPINSDVIKNMNDVFLSALNRSHVALTNKLENSEISKEDHDLLFDAIKKAKKLDPFKPIIVYTSSSFNEKYSTNYKRRIDYIKTKEKLSRQKN